MNLLQAIQYIRKPQQKQYPDLLPVPRAKVAPTPTAPKESGVYVEDEERRVYGFRMDKESDRKGAAPHLTGYDVRTLKERGLYGGKQVQAQNITCKRMWHGGESVSGAAAQMRLSESWVEKRFACFSTALSEEIPDRG